MADVMVLENQSSAFSSASRGDIHHRSGQVVGTNHLVGEQHPRCGIDRAQQAIAKIGFSARLHRVDVRGAEDVQAGKSCRGQCVLGLALVACEGDPAAPGRIRATAAQESECRVGTAGAEHSCELDGVIHGDPAEFRVRHRAGIGAQTKDRRISVGERAGERGTVREVLMEQLFQFRVREGRGLTADRAPSVFTNVSR